MKDLESILNILCNYQAGFVLSNDELAILSSWLEESEAHEKLFNDLTNKMKWLLGETDGNSREKIKMRLIELEETGG